MPDDKTKRGPPDAMRINMDQDYEVELWAAHFRVTAQQLKDCVERVGPIVTNVQRCLGK